VSARVDSLDSLMLTEQLQPDSAALDQVFAQAAVDSDLLVAEP
jgi:hypothetical protein